MFGHQDQSDDNTTATPQSTDLQADATLSSDSTTTQPTEVTPTASAPAIDENAATDYIVTDNPHTAPTSLPSPTSAATSDETPAAPAKPVAAPAMDDLVNLKQNALQQLSPLLGHLDQTPEEKFRTTMMMIQASDNHELLNAAYEAAQQIEDEKVRAQALLDVVNEINYFTQHNEN